MAQRVRDPKMKQALFHARPREIAVMKSSTKDQVAAKIPEFKGKVKEAAGKVTDNLRLESEGTAEKINGSIKKKVGEVEKDMGKEVAMASKNTKRKDGLNLTQEESESIGVAFPEEPTPVSLDMREHPLHEQIGCSLTEDDVTEVLTGEVTPESREDVEDLFADMQEEEADRQAD